MTSLTVTILAKHAYRDAGSPTVDRPETPRRPAREPRGHGLTMNHSKDTGTRGETAVVRACRTRGFPTADRLTMRGSLDRGDIGLCPGAVIEVKAGKAATTASDRLILEWLAETERERTNAGADVALLVTKRAGIGPASAHRWWCHVQLSDLLTLVGAPDPPHGPAPVRLTLNTMLAVLVRAGYGEPTEEAL